MKLLRDSIGKTVYNIITGDMYVVFLGIRPPWEQLWNDQKICVLRAVTEILTQRNATNYQNPDSWMYTTDAKGWLHSIYPHECKGDHHQNCFQQLNMNQLTLHTSFVKLVILLSGDF